MKIVKAVSFIHGKGSYSVWIWPAVYVSYHSYDDIKSLEIQFCWLNFIATIAFISDTTYYGGPLLYSKKDFAEYIEKGEEEFLKEKMR